MQLHKSKLHDAVTSTAWSLAYRALTLVNRGADAVLRHLTRSY